MKNLFTLIFLFISINLLAQVDKPIKKGNYIIGGHISVNRTSSTTSESLNSTTLDNNPDEQSTYKTTNSSTNLAFKPSIGYFFVDGLATGIMPIYSYSNQSGHADRQNNMSTYTESSNKVYAIGAGGHVKYYFHNGFLINLEFQYLYNKSVYSDNTETMYQSNGRISGITQARKSDTYYKTFGISPGLGYAIFLNSTISIEIVISYLHQTQKGTISSDENFHYMYSSTDNGQLSSRGTLVGNTNGLYLAIGLNSFL